MLFDDAECCEYNCSLLYTWQRNRTNFEQKTSAHESTTTVHVYFVLLLFFAWLDIVKVKLTDIADFVKPIYNITANYDHNRLATIIVHFFFHKKNFTLIFLLFSFCFSVRCVCVIHREHK